MDVDDDNSTDVPKTRSTEGLVPSNSSVLSLISVDRPLPTEPRAHAGLHFHKDKNVSSTQKVCSFCGHNDHSYISCDRNPIKVARYCTCTTVMSLVCWWTPVNIFRLSAPSTRHMLILRIRASECSPTPFPQPQPRSSVRNISFSRHDLTHAYLISSVASGTPSWGP